MLMFSCLLLSFVAYHQFSVASFKTVSVLRKYLKSFKEERRCSSFVVRAGRRIVGVVGFPYRSGAEMV